MKRFWAWYERNYVLNVAFAVALFTLQILHLVWLFGEVVVAKLTGDPLFVLDGVLRWPLVAVDYTEIPALVTVSLIYVNELRKRFEWRSVLYLLFLNSQWLHIFWITDEFVVTSARTSDTALPSWLAWIAILIDFLEVPVIVDTVRRLVTAVREERVEEFLRRDLAGRGSS